MNRCAAQLGAMIICGTFICCGSEILAQGVNKEVRREMKTEEKYEKAKEQNDGWASRKEAKLIKRLKKEGKFNTPASARGSEVKVYIKGEYITLGYFDETNRFRPYAQQTASLRQR